MGNPLQKRKIMVFSSVHICGMFCVLSAFAVFDFLVSGELHMHMLSMKTNANQRFS